MNTEKDRKELQDKHNQDEPEDDKNIEPVTNITPHVTNPSPAIVVIWRTRSLHDHDIIPIEEREKRERIVTSLVMTANSPTGGLICDHLLKYGGATIPELVEVIPTTGATASRTLRALERYNAVEEHGYVGPPYRDRGQPGPRVPIFIWKGADPQASIEAQKRYGDLMIISREASLEVERQKRIRESQQLDAQRAAQVLEIQNLTDQVFDALPRPLDKTKLTPVYDAMNLVGVDPTFREDVRTAVITKIIQEAT